MHNDRVEAVSNVLVVLQWSYFHCRIVLLCIILRDCKMLRGSLLFFKYKGRLLLFRDISCSNIVKALGY